ncbi:hypothetical protein [Phormidium sp. CCY1219]|uniref:hypothetical protein n=1 Tax=Phormidium sp. CCY1219 TaxID=2886104 RepID=UPI002D1F7223|nr:hypothetical protein [Phormidium sp. CCY1219]MEB3825894.1 hypothetical protein [Phormidium sp. CCY1219]
MGELLDRMQAVIHQLYARSDCHNRDRAVHRGSKHGIVISLLSIGIIYFLTQYIAVFILVR